MISENFTLKKQFPDPKFQKCKVSLPVKSYVQAISLRPLVSTHEQQAVSDVTKSPYKEMACQFISIYGKFVTSQTANFSRDTRRYQILKNYPYILISYTVTLTEGQIAATYQVQYFVMRLITVNAPFEFRVTSKNIMALPD